MPTTISVGAKTGLASWAKWASEIRDRHKQHFEEIAGYIDLAMFAEAREKIDALPPES